MANDCLRKMYVKLRYIPPPRPELPANCKQITFEKSPEIRILTGQRSVLHGRPSDEIIGIDFLCAVPSTSGAGAIILLLQVSAYIEWLVGFHNNQGTYVIEMHRLFVSMPMMFKLQGPRIALMAISPWYIKAANYASQIVAAFRKIDEIEKVMGRIMNLKKGFCPDDIKSLEEGLKLFETELNLLLERAASNVYEGEIARRMDHKAHGTGRFAGTRLA